MKEFLKILTIWMHIDLALPNPPGEFQKLLGRKLYKFLWNNGPDRICRKNIVNYIQAGGLRMVNVSVFITSLRVTWLRRLVMFSDNDNWTALSRIHLNKLFSLGDSYIRTVINNLRNPFWEHILEIWVQSFKIDSLIKTIYSPFWGNSLINGNGNYVINEWYNKGIRNVIDLIDENGLFYEFQRLQEKYEIHGTYLDYMQLISRIPRLWSDLINETSIKVASYKYNAQINCFVFYLLRNRRGCRGIYDMLISVNEVIIPNKWIN